MPSPRDALKTPPGAGSPADTARRVSKAPVAAGVILIALSLLSFLSCGRYSPEQVLFEEYVELTAPSAPAPAVARRTATEAPPRAGPRPPGGGSRAPSSLTRTDPDPRGPAPSRDDTAASPAPRDPLQTLTTPPLFEPAPAFADIASASRVFFAPRRTHAAPTPQDRAPAAEQDAARAPAADEAAPKKRGKVRRALNWLIGRPAKRERPAARTRNFCSVITLHPSTRVVYADPADESAARVRLSLVGFEPNCDRVIYRWSTTGGRIIGEGPVVVWNLSGAKPGTHVAQLNAVTHPDCPYTCEATAPVSVIVRSVARAEAAPRLKVTCPEAAMLGQPLEFTAALGGASGPPPTFNWTVSGGRITGGQGTPSLRVASGLGAQVVRASVEVPGRSFTRQASCTTLVAAARLRGEVVFEGNAPAGGARVRVLDNGRVAITDVGGQFDFGLPPGQYSVVASLRDGSSQLSVTLPPFSEKFVRFVLPAVAPRELIAATKPTPTPTPTPSSTPADPPPATLQTERYRIAISYPARFLQDVPAPVGIEVTRVGSQTSGAGGAGSSPGASHAFVRAALAQPPAQPFETFATVALIADGARVLPAAPVERPLGERAVIGSWLVKPAGGTQEVTLTADVRLWVRSPDGVTHVSEVWRRYPFLSVVGPPVREQWFRRLSPLLLLCGALAIAHGLRHVAGGRAGEQYIYRFDFGAPSAQAAGPASPSQTATASGTEGRAAGTTREVRDVVHCTVFSPPQAAPGDMFLVQVFAHLAEQAARLEEIAKSSWEGTRRGGSQRMGEFARGQQLAFTLQMPGLEVDEETQLLVWDVADDFVPFVQFGVSVPEDCKPRSIFGTVTYSRVTEEGALVPVGHIKFGFKVAAAAPQAAAVAAVQVAAPPASAPAVTLPPRAPGQKQVTHRKAFISYCSKDLAEVSERVQMLRAEGVECFMDVLQLRAGEDWQAMLYHYIDESDVFYLFWSRSAKASLEIRKEIDYALRRKADDERNPPELVPIPLEGPPIVPPPEDLGHLHFNDPMLYFRSAAAHARQAASDNGAPNA
ncbi:MAG TPA: TIR domain-containing protein [Pyrinomonadaceae bacterium]|nr:TIR domain-containing protein [Pyrinomonadaceae bacterium]